MAFWRNILKKEATQKSEAGSAAGPALVHQAPIRKESLAVPRVSKDIAGVLVSPQMTEKTTREAAEGVYVFKVWPRANKHTVAGAIRSRYGVDVEAVRMLNAPAKARVRGRVSGWKPGYKKAMVKVGAGQRIDFES